MLNLALSLMALMEIHAQALNLERKLKIMMSLMIK